MASDHGESAVEVCEHDWLHLREVPFTNVAGTWGDEFFCRHCLTKRKVKR